LGIPSTALLVVTKAVRGGVHIVLVRGLKLGGEGVEGRAGFGRHMGYLYDWANRNRVSTLRV
jgi:hypothetical protein